MVMCHAMAGLAIVITGILAYSLVQLYLMILSKTRYFLRGSKDSLSFVVKA